MSASLYVAFNLDREHHSAIFSTGLLLVLETNEAKISSWCHFVAQQKKRSRTTNALEHGKQWCSLIKLKDTCKHSLQALQKKMKNQPKIRLKNDGYLLSPSICVTKVLQVIHIINKQFIYHLSIYMYMTVCIINIFTSL